MREFGTKMTSKKGISTNITSVLTIIAKSLACEDITWVVISSCALALHGLDVDPSDIDIMTDESGLLTINRILGDYNIALSQSTPSTIFDSTLSKFCINNCSVEVMSNFKIKSGGTWHEMSNLLKHRIMLDVADLKIPVLPLEQLIEMYQLMGRDKDKTKIEKIEQYLIKT